MKVGTLWKHLLIRIIHVLTVKDELCMNSSQSKCNVEVFVVCSVMQYTLNLSLFRDRHAD